MQKYNDLALCTSCVCFAKSTMMMNQQFSRLRYVSPYILCLIFLGCREAAFVNYQMGCPLSLSILFSHSLVLYVT